MPTDQSVECPRHMIFPSPDPQAMGIGASRIEEAVP
jgi:hypothetical protein